MQGTSTNKQTQTLRGTRAVIHGMERTQTVTHSNIPLVVFLLLLISLCGLSFSNHGSLSSPPEMHREGSLNVKLYIYMTLQAPKKLNEY